ncbi:unnamed protein product [Plutella xylostella]|uniref:(diamondback moth) hypothetical protein n=1 Tax=Plutella xylostella TaxID=51655 RepID=A0A8S4D8T0_PLUXY|nr:unnamed protein product [Plutella xylostella]
MIGPDDTLSFNPSLSRGSQLTSAPLAAGRRGPVGARLRGQWLWEGRWRPLTVRAVLAPGHAAWQTIILVSVVYTYTMQLLILNYLDRAPWWLNLSLLFCSLLYFCDLVLHILHRKWLLVRINIRTKRRNFLTLVFDAVTLMMPSFWIDIYTLQPSYLRYYAIVSRWLEVLRIYRYVVHFWILNAGMQSHRKLLYMFEHVSITALVLHGAACLWFQSHRTLGEAGWGTLQYPMQGRIDNVAYDTYV